MQERLDVVEIDSEFQLEAAISSLRFYWNLARHKNQKLAYEVWAERGEVVPPKDQTLTTNTPRGSEFKPEEFPLPKLVPPANGTVLVAGETSWNN